LLPPAIFTTANSAVPPLLMAITMMVDCVAFTVPNVALAGTVTEIGETPLRWMLCHYQGLNCEMPMHKRSVSPSLRLPQPMRSQDRQH
jgi:hypothetical protein